MRDIAKAPLTHIHMHMGVRGVFCLDAELKCTNFHVRYIPYISDNVRLGCALLLSHSISNISLIRMRFERLRLAFFARFYIKKKNRSWLVTLQPRNNFNFFVKYYLRIYCNMCVLLLYRYYPSKFSKTLFEILKSFRPQRPKKLVFLEKYVTICCHFAVVFTYIHI